MPGWLTRSGGNLLLLLGGYFLLQIAIRLVLPHSLELDEGQQLFFSQALSLGYDSQPPFYNWLQWGAVQIFGPSVAALTILKNLLLFASFLFLWLSARLVLTDKALVAATTLGLMTITQVSFEAQRDLTHTVAVLFAATLFLYAFLTTLRAPSAWSYALTGLAVGIGLLSKYNFVLLPLAALVALLPDREFRRRLVDPRMLIALVLGAAVVLPHGLWFLQHVDVATSRTLGKLIAAEQSRVAQIAGGLAALAEALLAFCLPPLLVFAICFGRSAPAVWRAGSPTSRLIGRMMAAVAALLLLLVLFAGASDIRPRWLVPFYFLLPLWLCLKAEAAGLEMPQAPRRIAGIALVFMLAIALSVGLRPVVMGMTGHYVRPNVPYGPALEAILAEAPHRPVLIVASDQQLAGNVRLVSRDVAVAVPGFHHLQPVFSAAIDRPVLLVWRGKGEAASEMPQGLAAWIAQHPALKGAAAEVHDIAPPYHFGRAGDVYHFSYAWLHPAASAE